MIKIKSLKPKTKTTFQLTVDKPGESDHIVHQETVIAYQLFTRQSLDEKTYKALLKDDQFYHAYALALTKLARRNYTRKRLKEALKKDGVPQGIIHQVLDRLEKDNYVDEAKTLAMMLEDFFTFELKGRYHLRKKLEEEGFDEESIAQSLEAFSSKCETEKCQALIEKTTKSQKPQPQEKLKIKLQTKCYQSGFSQSLFQPLIEAYVKEIEATIDEGALLDLAIQKVKKQYDVLDHRERQKLIQKLMRQGFRYEMIQKKLNS